MTSSIVDSVLDLLWTCATDTDGPDEVFAILDGARSPDVERTLRASHLDYECLYRGPISRRLEVAAPHIVHLNPKREATRTIVERAWGRSWGFFARAPAGSALPSIRRHLRKLLRVRTETGRTLVFRFYDPRVLRVYLPTCTRAEAIEFFGPATCLLAESATGDSLLRYTTDDAGVHCAPSPVRTAAQLGDSPTTREEG